MEGDWSHWCGEGSGGCLLHVSPHPLFHQHLLTLWVPPFWNLCTGVCVTTEKSSLCVLVTVGAGCVPGDQLCSLQGCSDIPQVVPPRRGLLLPLSEGSGHGSFWQLARGTGLGLGCTSEVCQEITQILVTQSISVQLVLPAGQAGGAAGPWVGHSDGGTRRERLYNVLPTKEVSFCISLRDRARMCFPGVSGAVSANVGGKNPPAAVGDGRGMMFPAVCVCIKCCYPYTTLFPPIPSMAKCWGARKSSAGRVRLHGLPWSGQMGDVAGQSPLLWHPSPDPLPRTQTPSLPPLQPWKAAGWVGKRGRQLFLPSHPAQAQGPTAQGHTCGHGRAAFVSMGTMGATIVPAGHSQVPDSGRREGDLFK